MSHVLDSSVNSNNRRRNKVTFTACESCREKRAKCDGNEPCARCKRRDITCYYRPREWASKSSLRDSVDHFSEKLQKQERIIEAVCSPVFGDVVLQHLRSHEFNDTYDKLPFLTSTALMDGATTADTSAVKAEDVETEASFQMADFSSTTSGDSNGEFEASEISSATTENLALHHHHHHQQQQPQAWDQCIGNTGLPCLATNNTEAGQLPSNTLDGGLLSKFPGDIALGTFESAWAGDTGHTSEFSHGTACPSTTTAAAADAAAAAAAADNLFWLAPNEQPWSSSSGAGNFLMDFPILTDRSACLSYRAA